MADYVFKNPRFIKSAVHAKDYPVLKNAKGSCFPEIAVCGRSNVGKSSLLNSLFERKNLVKTSQAPGKTQMINFFTLDNSLAFVDLPGYGFAKVPITVRKSWGSLVNEYFKNRESLKLLLLLFDIRRMPTREDYLLMEMTRRLQLSFILILTKIDKVKRHERNKNTENILKAFGDENMSYIHFSTTKRLGRPELIAKIQQMLKNEEEE